MTVHYIINMYTTDELMDTTAALKDTVVNKNGI